MTKKCYYSNTSKIILFHFYSSQHVNHRYSSCKPPQKEEQQQQPLQLQPLLLQPQQLLLQSSEGSITPKDMLQQGVVVSKNDSISGLLRPLGAEKDTYPNNKDEVAQPQQPPPMDTCDSSVFSSSKSPSPPALEPPLTSTASTATAAAH